AIPTLIEDDQILNLKLDDDVVIPQQRGFNSYVLLQTDDALQRPGNYTVLKNKAAIGALSFNSARAENVPDYFTASDLGNGLSENIDDLIYKLTQEDNIISFWKYFVIGALFFLICELLILKYVK
ncbi:MAG: alpha-1-antitrypsin, partial [Nonlabens sp.]|nr:alpha-1-antitrypsin [Nonlabens sp.]